MAVTGDVRVGDVGTTYRAKLQDRDAPFDPSSAVELKFVWSMPSPIGPVPIERTALVEEIDGEWYLVYVVTNDDAEIFHTAPGRVKWQGFVRFAGGERYSTNIEEFRVEKNLTRGA